MAKISIRRNEKHVWYNLIILITNKEIQIEYIVQNIA